MQIQGESPPVFTSATSGRVTTGASAALHATEKGASLVRLTAPSTNTAPVYYGFTAPVTALNGIPIEAGAEKFVFIDDLSKIIVFSTAAQSIGYECYR